MQIVSRCHGREPVAHRARDLSVSSSSAGSSTSGLI